MGTIQVNNIDYTYTDYDIYKFIGYHEPPKTLGVNEGMVQALINEIDTLIRPKFTYKVYNGLPSDCSTIEVEDIHLDVGDVIGNLLNGATQYIVFAATTGKEFQVYLDQVKIEGDLLKTYFVDTIGSFIVELVGDILEITLEKEIGFQKHTNRFSPGYCGWNLIEQRKIFELLQEETIDITLSDVCLMNPVKSISGIIGVGDLVRQKQYACNYCTQQTCFKRKRICK